MCRLLMYLNKKFGHFLDDAWVFKVIVSNCLIPL